MFNEGTLKPLPLRVFPARQALDAFRTMARAEHLGKIVVAEKWKARQANPSKSWWMRPIWLPEVWVVLVWRWPVGLSSRVRAI